MKKLLLTLFIGTVPMLNLDAQDITDAVRYAQDDIQGSARFRALSGAFGALGGDMSAVGVNPAGSAIFNTNHASFSVSNLNINNNLSYFNTNTTASNSEFDFHQAGAAFVFENNSNSDWKKVVLSIAYDKTANYDTDWIARGTNNFRSIDTYFLQNAQGLRLADISAINNESLIDAYINIGQAFGSRNQQAFLGFESFIVEPDDISDDDNTTYTSNVGSGPYKQDYAYAATGYNGKVSFNLATQYQDNIYLGINVNTHFINYERVTRLLETNDAEGPVINDVYFENALSTIGAGISVQLGSIVKINQNLRVGLTYDSPTWYIITDETSQYLETFSIDGITGSPEQTFIVDPQVINVFPDYKLQTPAKLTGSAAIIFGKKGLLSFDYSRKDYSKTKFKPTSDAIFAGQNAIISEALTTANTYRIGGEYKYNFFSFRGGYRLEESPYKNTDFYGDLSGYSLGIGYNFGNTKLDITYDASERDFNQQLYNIGLTDATSISRINDNITVSLSFNL